MISLYGFENPYQLALPGFSVPDALPLLPRKALGILGEMTVWKALQQSGYTVQRARTYEGDLKAIDGDGVIYRVEVKTARQGKCGDWQFCIFRQIRRVCTDFHHADLLVLLPIVGTQTVPFIVPVERVTSTRQITLTSHPMAYAGRIAVYRQPDLPLCLPA